MKLTNLLSVLTYVHALQINSITTSYVKLSDDDGSTTKVISHESLISRENTASNDQTPEEDELVESAAQISEGSVQQSESEVETVVPAPTEEDTGVSVLSKKSLDVGEIQNRISSL